MTDQPDDEQLIAYMKRLTDLEQAGDRTTIVIGPFSAIVIIGLVQLATRHPDMSKRMKDIGRDFVQQLEPLFADTVGEEIVNRGKHPEWDR